MASDAPKALNRLGQSLWLDNITRDLLDSGTLKRYIDELSVTGLTSNPTIFDHAISRSSWYDAEIRRQLDGGASGEGLFFNLAMQDLSRAADLFAPVHARTGTVDGFVSLEVSPLLAYDTQATVAQAKALHAQGEQAQPVHQDPRHHRRPAGDRGSDLRRRPGQRHPAVLRRTVQGRGRCLSEGAGAARRRRPVRPTCARSPRCSSAGGIVAVARQGAGRAAQHARHRGRQAVPTRPIATCWRATASSAWRMSARGRSGCCSPAPAPRTRARRTRCTSPASRRRTR